MAKIELTPEELGLLTECINEQKDVPADLLTKLSPGFFEKLAADGRFDFKALDKFKIPTIEYAGKRPEAVILAQAAITGGAAPLQVVRSFANGKNGDWKNLIVQGDNLQFLKTCYMNQDPLVKDKIKGKVKLIYIDPPFATKGDFAAPDGADSYADRIERSEYIESMRERFVFLKQILSIDGNLFIHLDLKMGHYIKVVLDEVFGKDNFRNEFIWRRTYAGKTISRNFPSNTDCILWFSKSNSFIFNAITVPLNEKDREMFTKDDADGRGLYGTVSMQKVSGPTPGTAYNYTDINGRAWKCPAKGWRMVFDKMKTLENDNRLYFSDKTIREKYYLREREEIGKQLDNLWVDIGNMNRNKTENLNYPTQKPESLIERMLLAGSNNGDLIMDCFAGSGTTAAVAEKLGRHWITCDFGKHSVYTMQKRILNIADSKKLGNGEKVAKYGQLPKPFCVVSAGAYDFTRIMDLRKNQEAYITFVLGLFSIVREKADFSKKYKLPNIYAEKNGNPVEVFPIWDDEYLKNIRIDEEYLRGIIDASGGKLKGDYYIITPETCARLGDTTLKNAGKEKVNFKLLKFPYKVLEELSRHFQIEEQAASSADINRLISSVGFYFNEEVKIEVVRKNGGIKITKFNSGILDKNDKRFKGLEGLAMVLIDVNYDGKVFDMDVAVYSKDISEEGMVKVEGLTKDSHLIAIDKHGNESKIAKIK